MPTTLSNEANEKKFLTRLVELNSNYNLSLSQLIQEYLNLGLEAFDMELGILSQIEGDDYHVIGTTSNSLGIEPGQKFQLKETLCQEVYEEDKVVFISDLSQSNKHCDHPAAKNMLLESFYARPLHVKKRIYGTLSFSSQRPRKELSEVEELIMKTMLIHLSHRIALKEDQSLYKLMLRNVAHELRSPLNGIIGPEEILKESDLDHEQFEMLDLISRSSRCLEAAIGELSLVTKLLYFDEEEKCDSLDTEFSKITNHLNHKITKSGTFIKIPKSDSNPEQLGCSPDIFRNAVRLILQDCLLRGGERKEINLYWEKNPHYFKLIIVDNGPYVAPNVLEVINSVGTLRGLDKNIKVSGVNLDLTLAAITMQLSGGNLRVMVAKDSSSTTFTLSFPKV